MSTPPTEAGQLVEELGRQARRLAAEVPGGLCRVSVRAGDATVELEWAASPDPRPAPQPEPEADETDETGETVDAPLVGTFYHASEPGGPPFVRVGDVVAQDTVVGIVEAMKMMNKVLAGRAGTVTGVLVPDGDLVEYGQPLIALASGG